MKTAVTLAIAGLLILASPGSGRADGKSCPDIKLMKSGVLTGEGKSIGFIIGVRWGHGTVRMDDGRTFKFKAKGAKPAEMGAAKMSFTGVVYNLEKPEDFAGIYGGISGGLTVIKGKGGAALQNGRTCVVVNIKRDKVVGLQGSLPMLTVIHVELVE